jgi:hypothetical protein
MVQFLVDTQYDQVLTRAIGGKVVNSDVGREALFTEIMQIAGSGNTDLFGYLFTFPLQTSASNTAETNEAIEMLKAQMNRKALSTDPATSNPSGWSSQNTSDAINIFGQIFNTVSGFFTEGSPQPTTNPAPGPGDQQQQTPTNYTPWIIGGVGVLIIVIILVIVLRKKAG